MDDLLLLVHRIPYPPNKGDKIRSYQLLRYLAQRYRVHLGAFVDDPADWAHVPTVEALCASSRFVPLHPLAARARSLRALLRHGALSVDYYRDRAMTAWVLQCVRRYRPRRTVVFSSPMAQYAAAVPGRVVIDYCDVDSDKWRQYAERKPWPSCLVYRYEAQRLAAYERDTARQAAAALFVSAPEAALFRQMAPEAAGRTHSVGIGVDTAYFAPQQAGVSPYGPDETALVFCGAMDYWPNIDAVQWFANEVLPLLRAAIPSVRFHIVGARPSAQVRLLGQRAGVHVTGSLPDIRPYVGHAALSVAPLRIARGVQTKVLEAMAMAKTVVASPAALEGIDAHPGRDLVLAGDAPGYAAAVLDLLQPERLATCLAMGATARALVERSYGWEAQLAPLAGLLEAPASPCVAA